MASTNSLPAPSIHTVRIGPLGQGSAGKALAAAIAMSALRTSALAIGRRARPSWISTALNASFRAEGWRHPRRRVGQWEERVELAGLLTFGALLAWQDRAARKRGVSVAENHGDERAPRRFHLPRRLPGRLPRAPFSIVRRTAHGTAATVRRTVSFRPAAAHPDRVTARIRPRVRFHVRRRGLILETCGAAHTNSAGMKPPERPPVETAPLYCELI